MATKKNNMEQNAAVEKKTKQSYVKELRKMLTEGRISDESLKSKVESTLSAFDKDMTKVSKTDIVDLCNEVVNHLVDNSKSEEQTTAPAPKEASLKPKKKGGKSKKTEEPVEEVPETTEQDSDESAVTEETTPAKTEKSGKKKSSLKKSDKDSKKKTEVETSTPVTTIGADRIPCAKRFPAEIDHPELGKLIACTGEYTEYNEIFKALMDEENPQTLYFACYWTKRHIKEFGYNSLFDVEAPKGGFTDNLDIVQAVLTCETVKRLFAMSRYTEALYRFDAEDFEYIEDTDPANGEKFLVRVSQGMEFEIYRPADEVTTE